MLPSRFIPVVIRPYLSFKAFYMLTLVILLPIPKKALKTILGRSKRYVFFCNYILIRQHQEHREHQQEAGLPFKSYTLVKVTLLFTKVT